MNEIGGKVGICDSVRTSVVSPVPFWTSVPPHLYFHFDYNLTREKRKHPRPPKDQASGREGVSRICFAYFFWPRPPLIHLFPLEFVPDQFALVCGNMRSIGGFMRSFCGLCCARMRHYAPVCGVVRPRAFRAEICVSKDAPGKGRILLLFFVPVVGVLRASFLRPGFVLG